jgi:hypothetical protein
MDKFFACSNSDFSMSLFSHVKIRNELEKKKSVTYWGNELLLLFFA